MENVEHIVNDVVAVGVRHDVFDAVACIELYAATFGRVEHEEHENAGVAVFLADAPCVEELEAEGVGVCVADAVEHNDSEFNVGKAVELCAEAVELRYILGGDDGVGVGDVVVGASIARGVLRVRHRFWRVDGGHQRQAAYEGAEDEREYPFHVVGMTMFRTLGMKE